MLVVEWLEDVGYGCEETLLYVACSTRSHEADNRSCERLQTWKWDESSVRGCKNWEAAKLAEPFNCFWRWYLLQCFCEETMWVLWEDDQIWSGRKCCGIANSSVRGGGNWEGEKSVRGGKNWEGGKTEREKNPRCICIFLHLPLILFIKRLRLSWALIILSIFLLTCFFFCLTPHRVNTAVHLWIQDQFIFSHTTPDCMFNFITRHLFWWAANPRHQTFFFIADF